MYLSYFFAEFCNLSSEEKEKLLVEKGVWKGRAQITSADSDSSTTTTLEPNCHEINRLAALIWRGYDEEIKNGWGRRAGKLNDWPRNDGKFLEVPDCVVDSCIEELVKMTLTQEWLQLVQMLKNSVLMERNVIGSKDRVYTFGREKVTLGVQILRRFRLSNLMIVTMFGSPLFSKQLTHEIVHRTDKEVVLHFHSNELFSKLVTFGGIDGSVFETNNMTVFLCPKVALRDNMGRSITGYVMQEGNGRLGVKLDGVPGELQYVQSPSYNSDNHCYYPNGEKHDIFNISCFWPIRMKRFRDNRAI